MSKWLSIDLPYKKDCTSFFYPLLNYDCPIWLDSCAHATQGRYDILSAAPNQTLSQKQSGKITASSPKRGMKGGDFLAQLKRLIPKSSVSVGDFVFSGVLGFFSYEFGVKQAKLSCQNKALHALPEAWFGLYSWALIVDHQMQSATVVYQPQCIDKLFLDKICSFWHLSKTLDDCDFSAAFNLTSKFESNISYEEYEDAINEIQAHLRLGDTYQVNYSHCFSASFEGDSFSAYCALRQKNPSEFAVFLRLPEGDVLSFSPELLVSASDRNVLTKPIKGTARRSFNISLDDQIKTDLSNCPKNRAENMMILDLLRNDLSKVSDINSVNVDSFLEIETMPSVFHLVSTVSSSLEESHNYFDVIDALLPGGSITGAPKHRTMQLIEKLEFLSRGVYCGSIGHLSPDSNMCFNIAIRTMTASNGYLSCHAGGGIVLDSNSKDEYQETLDKIFVLTDTLQSMSKIIPKVHSEVGVV